LNNGFLSSVRSFFLQGFVAAAQVFLAVYVALLIGFYPKSFILSNNVASLAAVCGFGLFLLSPPKEKPQWPYWVFLLSTFAFYGLNVLAVRLAMDVPDMGFTSSSWKYLPELQITLATGLSLRSRKAATRVLAVLLIFSGLWYLGELASIPWRQVWMDNRYIASRDFHTKLAMELLLLFSLFLGCAALLKNRRWALASLIGAVLMAGLMLLTKTRFTLLTMAFITIPSAILIQRNYGSLKQRIVALLIWTFIVVPAGGYIWYQLINPERKTKTTAEFRITAWKISLEIAKKEPWSRRLIGYGRSSRTFDAVANYYQTNKDALLGKEFHHCHNALLQTFLETGILGVAALFAIWFSAFYRVFSAWMKKKGPNPEICGVLLMAMITMAVMNQMDFCIQGVTGYLSFFITGLAFAAGTDNGSPGKAAGTRP